MSSERIRLADLGLIAEPDLYRFATESLRDLRQTVGEGFPKRAVTSRTRV